MKITVITCYDQNDYVRARSLRTALQAAPGVEAHIIKNIHTDLLRYIEVPLKLLREVLTNRPDAYLLTFRGYELLPFVLLIKGRRPLIFDEFLNPAEYLAEHNRLQLNSFAGKLFVRWYAGLLKRCRFVLADTDVHADYSAELTGAARNKFMVLPVNADEELFHPRPMSNKGKDFEVFYYGNGMTPLHGLEFVLEAAVQLKDTSAIHFTIVGGKAKAEAACREAADKGANITYKAWVPFEEIPELAANAALCLGGPFGRTLQSQFVITGKTYQFLAAQRPVIIGKNQATGLFEDKKNCLLVEQGSATSIADAVRWTYAHQSELDSIAANGRRLYEEHFSQAIVNRQVAELTALL